MSTEAMRPLLGRLALFLLIVVAIALVFNALSPNYLSQRNILAMLRQMSVNGLVSIGLTFVIVLRRFDLSLAGIASFCAMTLGFILSEYNNLYLALAGAVAIGTLCGAASGIMIGRFSLPDVVTTIGVGSIAAGLAFIYSGGKNFSANFLSSGILTINDGALWVIPFPVVILGVAALLAYVLLHMSRFGQSFYAVGENPVSARLSGVPVKRFVGMGFAICGALVGVAMILNCASVGGSYVNTGNRVLLPSYTAVYLGAALFGTATIPASLAGALLMALLLNGFTLLTVPYYYSDAIVSLILIIAIGIFSPQTFIWFRDALSLFARPKPIARY